MYHGLRLVMTHTKGRQHMERKQLSGKAVFYVSRTDVSDRSVRENPRQEAVAGPGRVPAFRYPPSNVTPERIVRNLSSPFYRNISDPVTKRAAMSFDITTRTLLQYYTDHPPRTEDVWYGPWNAILTTLFPSIQGYVITPQRRIVEDSQARFLIEVAKISTPPLTLRTVLIVEIKNSQHWESGRDTLIRQIGLQADMTFAGTAVGKVYWIGTIGPHWIYGEKKDDDQDPEPLIAWHHITHDEASYRDLSELRHLVANLS